jgi:hypothetical protein
VKDSLLEDGKTAKISSGGRAKVARMIMFHDDLVLGLSSRGLLFRHCQVVAATGSEGRGDSRVWHEDAADVARGMYVQCSTTTSSTRIITTMEPAGAVVVKVAIQYRTVILVSFLGADRCPFLPI